jgi:hypothetical protein
MTYETEIHRIYVEPPPETFWSEWKRRINESPLIALGATAGVLAYGLLKWTRGRRRLGGAMHRNQNPNKYAVVEGETQSSPEPRDNSGARATS